MDNQDLMLKDIMDYISLNNPGGALLINGEWGCGKTYYVNNTLIPMYKDLVFVKVSLFGLNSYEDLISRVKEGYISQQIKEYGFEKYIKFDKNKVIKEIIQNLLPDTQQAVISALYQGLLGLGNTINGKKVVFIYDDLERVKLESDIVFGFINNQIENLRSSVIIIANEYEIIRGESDNAKIYFYYMWHNNYRIKHLADMWHLLFTFSFLGQTSYLCNAKALVAAALTLTRPNDKISRTPICQSGRHCINNGGFLHVTFNGTAARVAGKAHHQQGDDRQAERCQNR